MNSPKSESEKKQDNTFERHTQTALVLLLVALLLWVGNTTQSTAVQVAEMRVEIAYLKAAAENPSPHLFELSKRTDELQSRIYSLESDLREFEKKSN